VRCKRPKKRRRRDDNIIFINFGVKKLILHFNPFHNLHKTTPNKPCVT
jgi:hypothetical protein